MSWYRTGTISLTNGSKDVTGTGTLFVSNIKSGFALLAPDFSVYEVDNISSDTTLSLKDNYRGATVSGGAYAIFQTQGIIKDLTDEVTTLINTFGAFRDAYTNGDLVGTGLELKGVLNNPSELPASPAVGDAYLIGTNIYVYTGPVEGWKNSNIAGINPQGTWNASTAYAINDTVEYSGSQYRRKVAGTTSTDPSTDTTNWELFVSIGATGPAGITPRGIWNSATAYVVNDTVQYNGSQYRRIVAGTTSTDPSTDTTNWELFVSRGLDGAGSVVKVNNVSPDINGNVTLTTDNVTEGSTNQWFTVARVRSTVLTGLSTATNAVISATDSVLSALGKLQKQVSDLASSVTSSLGLKADLASPAFTGTPTAPTATSGTNTDQIATTAFVGNAVGTIPTSPTMRQTVLSGVINSQGYANMLSSGSGLSLNLSATSSPMKTSFAQNQQDFVATLSADATGVIAGLTANALSYIYQDYVSNSSVTWGKTLAPVQYGYIYDKTTQSLLHFEGTAGSTTIIDDFGNTWTSVSGAKLQSTQVKFGSTALGGSGTSNALNGSSDYIECTNFISLGGVSWTIRGNVYTTVIGTTSNGVFSFTNSSGYGVNVAINSSGKTVLSLSSNGSSNDIAAASLGTATLTNNSWNKIELTYDAVAGKYILYVNGNQDQSVTSSARICSIVRGRIGYGYPAGSGIYFSGYIDEFELLPYCEHTNGTSYTVETTPADITIQGYCSDFFNIGNMTMYKVSGPSTTAGTNPAMTSVKRVYVSECVTGTSSVSSVINYAINSRYDSGWVNTLPSAGTLTNKNHNLGVLPNYSKLRVRNINAEGSFIPGQEITPYGLRSSYYTPIEIAASINSAWFANGDSGTGWIAPTNSSGGGYFSMTASNWSYRLIISRGW